MNLDTAYVKTLARFTVQCTDTGIISKSIGNDFDYNIFFMELLNAGFKGNIVSVSQSVNAVSHWEDTATEDHRDHLQHLSGDLPKLLPHFSR